MTITEDMITPHHLNAAERWIAANGIPDTDAESLRMAREVTQEAQQTVEHMAEKTLSAIATHRDDLKHSSESLEGSKGREFLEDIYHTLRARA